MRESYRIGKNTVQRQNHLKWKQFGVVNNSKEMIEGPGPPPLQYLKVKKDKSSNEKSMINGVRRMIGGEGISQERAFEKGKKE
jgi:hypothetical protein